MKNLIIALCFLVVLAYASMFRAARAVIDLGDKVMRSKVGYTATVNKISLPPEPMNGLSTNFTADALY